MCWRFLNEIAFVFLSTWLRVYTEGCPWTHVKSLSWCLCGRVATDEVAQRRPLVLEPRYRQRDVDHGQVLHVPGRLVFEDCTCLAPECFGDPNCCSSLWTNSLARHAYSRLFCFMSPQSFLQQAWEETPALHRSATMRISTFVLSSCLWPYTFL